MQLLQPSPQDGQHPLLKVNQNRIIEPYFSGKVIKTLAFHPHRFAAWVGSFGHAGPCTCSRLIRFFQKAQASYALIWKLSWKSSQTSRRLFSFKSPNSWDGPSESHVHASPLGICQGQGGRCEPSGTLCRQVMLISLLLTFSNSVLDATVGSACPSGVCVGLCN